MKKLALFASFAFLLGAANVQAGVDPAVATAINEAVNANLAADKVKNTWRDTWKFIGKAKDAARKGDNETAMKLAKKAKFQGDAAVAQSKAEAGAKPPKFLR